MISNGSDCIKMIRYHDGKPIEKFVEFLLAGCKVIVISGGGDEYFWYMSIDEGR